MNLYFRLIGILLKNLFNKGTLPITSEVSTPFRVRFRDLDINFHMNNGRYLTIMDLARLDFMCKTGIFKQILKGKWTPFLGAAQISFLRPLNFWQKYTVHTTIECWDEKWFVMVQRFESNGKICAIGKIRGVMKYSEGTVNPNDIIKAVGSWPLTSPSPSKETQGWFKSLPHSNKN